MTKRLRSPSLSSDDDRTFEESGTQTTQDTASEESRNTPPGEDDEPETDGRRIVGQVKWFNVKKGWGFIIGENGEDIFVHQSGVNKAGFRSLDDGEMVEYEIRNTDKGPEACKITGPSGSAVMGSQRRKRMRILQKQRKNRCFNCNVEGHIASSCPIPNTTKRCHVCLKDDHLMRQCPHQPLLLQQEALSLSPGLSPGLMGSPPTTMGAMSSTTPHIRPPIVTQHSGHAIPQPPPPSASIITQIQLQQQLQQQLLQQAQLTPQQILQNQQILQSQQLAASPQLYYTMGGMQGMGAGQPFMYTYMPRFPPGPPL